MSLREFARRAGLSPSYISDVERGNRQLSKRVAAAYEELRKR